jgi:hypothetical protein
MQRRLFLGMAVGAFWSALSIKKAFGATENKPNFIPLPEVKSGGAMPMAANLPLPAPDKMGGAPLMQALARRHATRDLKGMETGGKEIPPGTLSSLLWATWGINRADGKRTAPTANNNQAANVYVALKNGIWLYNAQKNQLELQLEQDMRGALGKAPLVLIYAAKNDHYGAMAVGALFQNAGLYCASAGLGNVVRASNVGAVDKLLKIPDGYKIWVTQAVGWAE